MHSIKSTEEELEIIITNKLLKLIEDEKTDLLKKLEKLLEIVEQEKLNNKNSAALIRMFLDKGGYC